ncbi:MAG: sensor domain-containing diguanylate cyclase [Planctomycetes bacterium]|nr:sensor domain-containing diguanylate cyclase [Planctomycetota bacterium]
MEPALNIEGVLGAIEAMDGDPARRAAIHAWVADTHEKRQQYEKSFKRLRLDFATILEVTKQISAKSLDLALIESFTLNMVMGQFAVLKGLIMRRDNFRGGKMVTVAGKNVQVPDLEFDTAGAFAQKLVALGRPAFIREEDHALDVFDEVGVLRGLDMHVLVPLVKSGSQGETELMGLLCLGPKFGHRDYETAELNFLWLLGSMIGISLFNAQLYHRSVTDALTRIYSRGYFDLTLNQEMERCRRYSKPDDVKSVSLFMIDIDKFKSFNDTYGHQVGDEVLRTLANLLIGSMRKSDTVARYGGEEFSVILPETHKKVAMLVAERLRRNVETHRLRIADGRELQITISMGVGTFPEDADDPLELIRTADQALYAAKETGRNRVVAVGDSAVAVLADRRRH